MNQNELIHYGVKGMKWGKHKKANWFNTKVTGSYYKQQMDALDEQHQEYSDAARQHYKESAILGKDAAEYQRQAIENRKKGEKALQDSILKDGNRKVKYTDFGKDAKAMTRGEAAAVYNQRAVEKDVATASARKNKQKARDAGAAYMNLARSTMAKKSIAQAQYDKSVIGVVKNLLSGKAFHNKNTSNVKKPIIAFKKIKTSTTSMSPGKKVWIE